MRSAECGIEGLDIEQGTVSTSHSAFRIPHSALSLLNHRDLEPIRIGQGERPVAPGGFGRLAVQRPPLRLDPLRYRDDVLDRRHPQAEAVALRAIASFREVVLAEHDVAAAGFHLDTPDFSLFFPAPLHAEPPALRVP